MTNDPPGFAFDDRETARRDATRRDDGFRHGEAEGFVPPEEPSGCRRAAFGCGLVAAIVVLLLVALVIWVAMSWKRWTVSFTRRLVEEMTAKAPLVPDDRRRILAAFDRVGDAFVAGRIDGEALAGLAKDIVEGPILPLTVVTAADKAYLEPSGLSPEERDAARRTLERVGRGILERSFDEDDAEEITAVITEPDPTRPPPGRQRRLRRRLDDGELRALLARLDARLDELGVPDEPFVIDVTAELEQAVDRALRPRGDGPPPPPPEPLFKKRRAQPAEKPAETPPEEPPDPRPETPPDKPSEKPSEKPLAEAVDAR